VEHVGILAHSFEGATLCYRTVCLEGVRRLGPHLHPEVTLTGIGMHYMMDAYGRGDYAAVRELLVPSIGKLAAAGADFFVCPDNTAHISFELEGAQFAIPCLHIGEVVAEQALREGRRKVAILGTDYTMTGPVYPGALGRRGIGWATPNDDDRRLIHRVIFDELCLGVFKESSREAYVRIIEKLAEEGCDSVALVCTEIPLLISAEISPLPILDSTRLLAAAAVDVAIGERSMPHWRGGPV
jgi:aspartate racemase